MNESETFLRRWSRRKREGPESRPERDAITGADPDVLPPTEEHAAAAGPAQAERRDLARADGSSEASAPALGRVASEAPEFDLSHLPPIESITATTDIRPFLARGVPESLRRAALRRAWSADPAIRDFIGLAENQWDFTAENGVPGFGPLLQSDDVQQLVAQVFGTARPDSEPAGGEVADASASKHDIARTEPSSAQQFNQPCEAQETGEANDAMAGEDRPEEGGPVGTNFAALQDADAVPESGSARQSSEDRPQRRSHGGALPT